MELTKLNLNSNQNGAYQVLKFQIKIAKAKQEIEVEFDTLPPAIKAYVVEQGLSKLLNAATAKITKANTGPAEKDGKTLTAEENIAASAMALAEKKLESLQAGKMVARTKKAGDSKVDREVLVEARRQAKLIVKAKLKAANKKISDYTAKALTEAANVYLESHPELIADAQAAINEASKHAASAELDVAAIPVDPDKIKANEEKKAKAKAATAAKNAGKPGPQKPAIAKRGAAALPQAPKRAPAEVHAGA